MPQKTFLNLDPTRQREIVDACLEEFVRYDYRDVSLTRIIQKLGLAKGSFYRYFESKHELYLYLLEYARRQSQALFTEIFSGTVEDVFDAWVTFFLACVEHDNAHPLLGSFGYRVMRERDNVALGDVPRRALERGFEFLTGHLRDQQERGSIRPDVNVKKLVFLLVQIQNGLLDYLSIVHEVDFEANVKSGRPLFTIPMDTLRAELESFVELARCGFAGPVSVGKGGGA